MITTISYTASDGTVFSTPEACLNYEKNLEVHPVSFARFFSTKHGYLEELNLDASTFSFCDVIAVLDKEKFLGYYKDEPAILAQIAPILEEGSYVLYRTENNEWRDPYDIMESLQERINDISYYTSKLINLT